jgi:hypothetical protein
MKVVYIEDFSDIDSVKSMWDWKYPWGATEHKHQFTEWENVRFEDDGLHFFHSDGGDRVNSGMIYWDGIPFRGIAKYSFDITAPRYIPCAAWLLSDVTVRHGVRTILPEIDVAEFGLHNMPNVLNLALHSWRKGSYPDHHTDDYLNHNISSKQLEWPVGRHTYTYSVGRYFSTFSIDGQLKHVKWGYIDNGLVPLFTLPYPDWYYGPLGEVILHNFRVEQ